MGKIKKYIFKKQKHPNIINLTLNASLNLADEMGYPAGVALRGLTMPFDNRYIYFSTYGTPEKTCRILLDNENDLSSFVLTQYSTFNSQPLGTYIKQDGTKIWQCRVASQVDEATLTTPYLPTPYTKVTDTSISGKYIYSFNISPDGLKMFQCQPDGSDGGVYEVDLVTPYELLTRVSAVNHEIGDICSISFIRDGNYVLAYSVADHSIYLRKLNTPYTFNDGFSDIIQTVTIPTATKCNAAVLSSNEQYLYIIDDLTDLLLQFSITIK